MYCLLFLINLV